MAVFVYRIGSLGDSIVSIPAIKQIKKIHQNEEIFLITNAPNSTSLVDSWNIFKHAKVFNGVLYYSNNVKVAINLIKKIRTLSCGNDVLYYLPPARDQIQVFRDYIYFRFLCGIKRVVGFKNAVRKRIIRDKGKLMVLPKESERLLHMIGFKEKYVQDEVFLEIPDSVKQRIDSMLENNLINIAISSGSNDIYRKWPIQKYKELCKKIISIERMKIYFVGGELDREEGELILEGISESRALNLAGKANIIETAYLFQKCSLFIGNNSGNLHLAASMNIPTVGIYSARFNPGIWDPIGNKSVVFRGSLDCEGCAPKDCIYGKPKCLEQITVDEVFKKIVEILGNTNQLG